jgi:hypothetical protein
MFEHYWDLIENFKQHDIAGFLKAQREQILKKLTEQNYFSDEVQPYFSNFNSDPSQEPFTNFASEPKQVRQVKQVINALYHAQLAFEKVQSIENISHLKVGPSILDHAYQASYLITHLDIDINEILGEETVQHVLWALAQIQNYASEHQDTGIKLASFLNTLSAHTVGWAAGVAIDQMQPTGGSFDYDFLTQFGALLPGYIQEFREYMQKQFAPTLTRYQPTVNSTKLEDLQEAASKLLKSLENLQSGDILISFKASNYIKILRHIFTLSTSILEQIGYTNDSSQKLVCHYLKELKYVYLPALFSLVDRLEAQAMLKPGTLSKPLMAQIKPLYEELGLYAAKIVNFSERGKELLTIEDEPFTQLRLKPLYERIANAQWHLIEHKVTQTACEGFFKILAAQEKQSLARLPKETKLLLTNHYKFLHPYLKAIDPDLAVRVVNGLNEKEGSFWKANDGWILSAKEIPEILDVQTKLLDEINKHIHTHEFHIKLNEDILDSITSAPIAVFPGIVGENRSDIDEIKVLGFDKAVPSQETPAFINKENSTVIANPDLLNAEQLRKLYEYHAIEISHLKKIKTAWDNFQEYIAQDPNLTNIPNPETKARLRSWYCLIHPYFLQTFKDSKAALTADETIINKLSDATENNKAAQVECFDEAIKIALSEKLKILSSQHELRLSDLSKLITEKRYKAIQAQSLEVLGNAHQERADFVLQQKYSESIAAYRTSLYQLIDMFSESFKQSFKPAMEGVPFPALADRKNAFLEAKQVVGMKRIFNSLYYLEQICLQLEQLHNNDYKYADNLLNAANKLSDKYAYVNCIIKAKSEADKLLDTIKELAADPHFSLLATDLKEKAAALYGVFMQQKEIYAVSSEDIHLQHLAEKEPPVHSSGLWYALHTFMVVPEHLYALNKGENFSGTNRLEIANKRAKQAAVNIERIIAESNSYFKLFLDIPTMYPLYKELKNKLKDFTQASYVTAISNLEALNTDLFTRILIETDTWEEKLGLKPGLLADPMKAIFDEFYKGLLEPLDLTSQERIILVSNLAPITARKEAAQNRKDAAKLNLSIPQMELDSDGFLSLNNQTVNLEESIPQMELDSDDFLSLNNQTVNLEESIPQMELDSDDFLSLNNQALNLEDDKYRFSSISLQDRYALLNTLETELSSYSRPHPKGKEEELKLQEEKITKLFNLALPLLTDMGTQLKLFASLPSEKQPNPAECFLQSILDQSSVQNTEKSPLAKTNISQLISTIVSYYRGLDNSARFEMDTAEERIKYLEGVQSKQKEATRQFIEEYTAKTYEKQFHIITSSYILLHTRDEYNQALQNKLLECKESVISTVRNSAIRELEDNQKYIDIDQNIKVFLDEQAKDFANSHFSEYQKLEKVRNSIAEFEVYFSKMQQSASFAESGSLFENQTTLSKKIPEITRLKKIATQTGDSIKSRLDAIKAIVETTAFKTKILSHRHHETLTFSWLQQWLISLCTTLGIYTPKHQAITERLLKAAVPPKEPANASGTSNGALQNHGLFAAQPAPTTPQPSQSIQPILTGPLS